MYISIHIRVIVFDKPGSKTKIVFFDSIMTPYLCFTPPNK